VMIIDLDAERGRISLSTKQLEPEPGDMVKNPQAVYDNAEAMAEKYREQMAQAALAAKEQAAAASAAVEPEAEVEAEPEMEAESEEVVAAAE
jgi:small subunit ribosomal protein S1